MQSKSVSQRSVIQEAIEDLIVRLESVDKTAERRALLIEALRLRSIVGTWRAVPPPPVARVEMLARISQLAAHVSAPVSGRRPASPVPAPSEPVPTLRTPSPFRRSPPPVSRSPVPAHSYGSEPPSSIRPILPEARKPDTPPPAKPRDFRVALSAGVLLVRPDSLAWQPLIFQIGIERKVLSRNPEGGRYSALYRLGPGTELPAHAHSGPEEILVLEGEAELGSVPLRAGDYCRSEVGSVHEAMSTEGGCVILLSGAEEDEFPSDV